jgi:two-component system, LytTR family, response regulator
MVNVSTSFQLCPWTGSKLRVLHGSPIDHISGETMASLETRLDPVKFVRVHRSTIVNAARIVTLHTMVGGVCAVALRGGTRINTGRQYRDRIRKLLSA